MLENLKPILIVILPVLIIAYITIRYTETKKKREKYNEEYSNFRGVFLDFINALKSESVSLNYAILTEFEVHQGAKDIFIHNLKGFRLKRFNEKWAEYEREYYKIKDLGIFGVAAAIAPDAESLRKATSLDAQQWEFERKANIHRIVTEVLEISKRKIWL